MRAAAALLALWAADAAACAPPEAAFFAPVDRYGHRVLGDTPEWAGLRLGDLGVTLPDDRIFEDVAPRVADIGGDCVFEAVVVESGATEGAQLAVYAPDRGRLTKIAATPAIGRAFRWLAPAGVADLDGDGVLDVAFIRMPHILGALEVWTFAPGGLTRVAVAEGHTNHRIGEARIAGGVRDCGEGGEIVTANVGWTRIMATRLQDGALTSRSVANRADAAAFADVMACR